MIRLMAYQLFYVAVSLVAYSFWRIIGMPHIAALISLFLLFVLVEALDWVGKLSSATTILAKLGCMLAVTICAIEEVPKAVCILVATALMIGIVNAIRHIQGRWISWGFFGMLLSVILVYAETFMFIVIINIEFALLGRG